jgi:hypothetical protein
MKYWVAWIFSFLFINQLWMMWEEVKYGAVMADNFDGLILFLLCFSLVANWYLVDVLKGKVK